MPFDGTNEISNPIIERLRLGRDRVSKGWIQHRLAEPSAPHPVFCVRGALVIPECIRIYHPGPCFGMFDYSEVVQTAEALLAKAVGEGLSKYFSPDVAGRLVAWNNDSVRTQQDVVAAFDKAIELAVSDEVAKRAELVSV